MRIFTGEHAARLGSFLDLLEQHIYPEKPTALHEEITAKAMNMLFAMFPFPRGSRVLDVGCGQGPALEHFQHHGHIPVGITLGDEDLEVCRRHGFTVAKMDQSFLDFEDQTFDLVWARHVLEHSIFPLYTIAGFERVLKDRGLLYLEVPAPDTSCHHERNPNHYSVLTRSSWETHLNRCGFEIVRGVTYQFTVQAGSDEYWGFYCRKTGGHSL